MRSIRLNCVVLMGVVSSPLVGCGTGNAATLIISTTYSLDDHYQVTFNVTLQLSIAEVLFIEAYCSKMKLGNSIIMCSRISRMLPYLVKIAISSIQSVASNS